MAFLQGKKLLITGVLSNRSIAYGIAQACHREGAELAFTYVGERFKDRITEFAKEFNSELVFDCDVGSDEQIAALFADLGKTWPKFDGFVHAIGFAPREAIAGEVGPCSACPSRSVAQISPSTLSSAISARRSQESPSMRWYLSP